MPTPLGTLLKDARKAKKLTQQQVGERVGISYSAVGQYESGTIKQPRYRKLVQIAEVLDIPLDTLRSSLATIDDDTVEGFPVDFATTSSPVHPRSRTVEVVADRSAPALQKITGARDVPELGIAVGGTDGDFTLNGETLDYVPRPAALAARDVFAVRVKSDSMSPRYEEGHLLYVERRREPRPGEDAIIEMRPDVEGAAGRAFVKQIVRKSIGQVVARQFNPAGEITYDRDKIKAMYRVVPNNELFGV